MNLNQLSIIGFLGKDAEQKSLQNGTSVVKFSVATKRSWKDKNDDWQERTQWHQVVGFGDGFAKLAERLAKGAHVFVQGELTTREYDRIIKVPNGKKVIEHQMKQLVVELKADTIRILDVPQMANAKRPNRKPPIRDGGPLLGAFAPFHKVSLREISRRRNVLLLFLLPSPS